MGMVINGELMHAWFGLDALALGTARVMLQRTELT